MRKMYRKFLHILSKLFKRKIVSEGDTYHNLMKEMNFIIQDGPFKKMKYIGKSNGSALFPKIVGLYERNLHGVIEQIVNFNYDNYVDIGCAEGYYAVGIAYRVSRHRHNFKVFAYDIDDDALTNLEMLAAKNDVAEYIEIGKTFKPADFDKFKGSTVVICDIEGEERNLLDPTKCSALLSCDILVEVHDGGLPSGPIKDTLQSRFQMTHEIKVFHHIDHKGRVFKNIPEEYETNFMSEGRKYGLEWMWMKVKTQSNS